MSFPGFSDKYMDLTRPRKTVRSRNQQNENENISQISQSEVRVRFWSTVRIGLKVGLTCQRKYKIQT